MGQRYTSISDLYKQVKLNEQEIIERKLTSQELEDREKIAKKLPMDDFKKRYGKDAMAVKMATATNIVKKKSREEDVELIQKVDEKYDLYHSTFSDAMQHAYDYAKKKLGITVDPKEIDSKVATGPKKPSEGKTNKYRLKGKGGNLQIQVFNKGGSKPFELNMYKEETELDEMIPKSTMYALVKDGKVIAKGSKRDMVSKMKKEGGKVHNAPSKKVGDTIKESVDIQEDGHQDVASAIRQCKTITEDAMQILQKLQTMSPEDALPTWWTNKLAVASNSMNKMRDYLLVPSVSESIELDEKAGDIPDLKKLIGELQNASKMHLAQSKRVQAHVDMMTSANAKGPKGAGGLQDLKNIVGELEKASQAHLRQSKSIDAHVDFMGESLDEALKHTHMVLGPDGRVIGMSSNERGANDIAKNNFQKVKGRVVKLRKPMATTRGDRLIGMLPADNLGEGTLNEQPEHEITVGNYTTKHFFMCGSAQTVMKKHADKDGAEELTRMQDVFYKMEHDAMLAGGANDEQKKKSQILYDKIIAKAKEVGIADEVDKYMKMHLDSMLKNDPKLGFGRTDKKESYQEMISRIMSRGVMR